MHHDRQSDTIISPFSSLKDRGDLPPFDAALSASCGFSEPGCLGRKIVARNGQSIQHRHSSFLLLRRSSWDLPPPDAALSASGGGSEPGRRGGRRSRGNGAGHGNWGGLARSRLEKTKGMRGEEERRTSDVGGISGLLFEGVDVLFGDGGMVVLSLVVRGGILCV